VGSPSLGEQACAKVVYFTTGLQSSEHRDLAWGKSIGWRRTTCRIADARI
jgi:hypothetical protein